MRLSWHKGRRRLFGASYTQDLSGLFFEQKLDSRFPKPQLSEKKLILIHTGRCGSTLLHGYFISRGLCPPFEILNPEGVTGLYGNEAVLPVGLCDHLHHYRRSILGTLINDTTCVVSYSFTPWTLAWAFENAPEVVEWLFCGALLVFLTRRNVLRQAVSYVTAERSGRWHSTEKLNTQSKTIERDQVFETSRAIEYLDLILWGERLFEQGDLRAIVRKSDFRMKLTYESVAENPAEIVEGIADMFGFSKETQYAQVNPGIGIPVRLPRSEDLYQKMLSLLPIPLPSGVTLTSEWYARRFIDN